MVNVSKNPMSEQVSRRIRNNFACALFGTRRSPKARMLEALLSATERVMLTKRLAIIVMLEREYSYYRISKTLKVSVSTVMRVEALRTRGVYRPIQSAMHRSVHKSLLDEIEILLAAGMPSIAGPRHQRRLDRLRGR